MSNGHFNESQTLAYEKYGYKSPESTGTLPLGVVVNGKKYILFTARHPGVCDSKGCQKQYAESCETVESTVDAYQSAPLYSHWGEGELCVVCAGVGTSETFEPTEEETQRLADLLSDHEDGSDSSDEGDDSADETPDEDEEDSDDSFDGVYKDEPPVEKMSDLTMSTTE